MNRTRILAGIAGALCLAAIPTLPLAYAYAEATGPPWLSRTYREFEVEGWAYRVPDGFHSLAIKPGRVAVIADKPADGSPLYASAWLLGWLLLAVSVGLFMFAVTGRFPG